MIVLTLLACHSSSGLGYPPDPIYFAVEVDLPDGTTTSSELVGLKNSRLTGGDCLEGTWVGDLSDQEGVLVAEVALGWAESEVALDSDFSAVGWGDNATLRGGVLTITESSASRVEATVEGERICDRVDGNSEETCEETGGIAVVRIEGDFAGQMEEEEGNAGFGTDMTTGEPVCGLWDAPAE